jgi:hypothetical protein
MSAESIACTRCKNPSTLRMGSSRVCLQCGSRWEDQPEPVPDGMEPALHKRLRAYRDAVRAGLYSDFRTRF